MDPVEEVKARVSIEDVVGRHVDLKRSGANFRGLCPFHQEKTPSFYVTPARGTFHCFGCSKGGDVIAFVMELERIPFPEALGRLAVDAGVTLPERGSRKPSLKNKLYEMNEAACLFFRDLLTSARGQSGRRYLEGRGFGADAVQAFGLGYATEERDGLVRELRGKGFDDRMLLTSGLALQDDSGNLRDRFHGRIIFPIRDPSGKLVGFGGRVLDDESPMSQHSRAPKYLNSPQTEVFDKSGVLFGVHLAQDGIKTEGRAVLVEGYLDVIRAHQRGYRYVVASLGTAVTSRQLEAVARLTRHVVIALDPDPAGRAAAARTCLTALADITRRQAGKTPNESIDLRIAELPEELGDPDDLIQKDPERWEQALKEPVEAFDFYFSVTMQEIDRSQPHWRQEAIDRLLPAVSAFSGRVGLQAVWLERLARETNIDPRLLQRSLPSTQRRPESSGKTRTNEKRPDLAPANATEALSAAPQRRIEASLLGLLLQVVILPPDITSLQEQVLVRQDDHQRIWEALQEWQKTRNNAYEMFRETLSPEDAQYADGLLQSAAPGPQHDKIGLAVSYHLERLHYFDLQSRLSRAGEAMSALAPEDQDLAMTELSKLMNERLAVERSLEQLSREVVQSTPHRGGA